MVSAYLQIENIIGDDPYLGFPLSFSSMTLVLSLIRWGNGFSIIAVIIYLLEEKRFCWKMWLNQFLFMLWTDFCFPSSCFMRLMGIWQVFGGVTEGQLIKFTGKLRKIFVFRRGMEVLVFAIQIVLMWAYLPSSGGVLYLIVIF